MSKSNPIGVRFDNELLEKVKNASLADSPQKALNLYERTYIKYVESKIQENNKPENKAKIIKDRERAKATTEKPVWDKTKESWIDFRVRESEWIEKQNKQ